MALAPLILSYSLMNFFDIGGLIEQINVIFIVNILVATMQKMVGDRFWLTRLFKVWLLNRYLDEDKGGPYNQREAHEAITAIEFDISKYYAWNYSYLGVTLFYFTIFPFGAIYCIPYYVLSYWTSKVSKSSRKNRNKLSLFFLLIF